MDRTFSILYNYQQLHNQAVALFNDKILDDNYQNAQIFRSLVIISLHTSLEVLFKDIIANYFQNHPDSLDIKSISDISIKISSFQSGSMYSDIILGLRANSPKNLNILLKYRYIIEKILELKVLKIEEDSLKRIKEFSAMRNITLHNNRRVDSDYLKNIPWKTSDYKIGDSLEISVSDYINTINAIFELVSKTILTAFIPEPYMFTLKGIDFDFFENIDPYDIIKMRRRYREWIVKRHRRYGFIHKLYGKDKSDLIHFIMNAKTMYDF